MRSEDRLLAAAWAVAVACGTALGAGWISIDSFSRVPLCAFRLLTGLPCPGCGMGHSVLEFFSGDWIASFASHPLGPFVAVAWTAWTFLAVRRALRPSS